MAEPPRIAPFWTVLATIPDPKSAHGIGRLSADQWDGVCRGAYNNGYQSWHVACLIKTESFLTTLGPPKAKQHPRCSRTAILPRAVDNSGYGGRTNERIDCEPGRRLHSIRAAARIGLATEKTTGRHPLLDGMARPFLGTLVRSTQGVGNPATPNAGGRPGPPGFPPPLLTALLVDDFPLAYLLFRADPIQLFFFRFGWHSGLFTTAFLRRTRDQVRQGCCRHSRSRPSRRPDSSPRNGTIHGRQTISLNVHPGSKPHFGAVTTMENIA